MKFFVDTANLDEIRQAHDLGLLDGVTTNPSLVAKEGVDFKKRIAEICAVVKGPVSAEVTTLTAAEMIEEGAGLATIAPNVAVKVPLTLEGLRACRELRGRDIMVNVTLCFSPNQALLAAKAGASYISPFIGRLDDISENGMELIEKIVTIYNNYDYETEVLVASVRNPTHVVDAAMLGADICTIPFSVMTQLVKHPLTDVGLKKFLADWEKVPK